MNAPHADENRLAEEVDVIAHTPASILILEAMLFAVGADADLQKSFGIATSKVVVEMTVNGRPVPIVKSLEDAWRRCEAEIDARARKMAVRMVTEAGLEPLAEVLRDAEQKIRNKLQIWDDAND